MDRDVALFQLFEKRRSRPVEQQDLHLVAIGGLLVISSVVEKSPARMAPRQLRHQPLSAAGPEGGDDVENLHAGLKEMFGNLFAYAGLVCQRGQSYA